MSIIQISKIQQRAGNLVDLPQLDNAQLGWATDARRLFIGRTGGTYANENIEVLTSYSNISFSQITGSYGTNVNLTNVQNGQILGIEAIGSDTYVVNKGGAAGGLVTLGSVSNVKITGGAIGYVLETDGTGNLSWTPKGYVVANIKALSNATPIIMTVANTTPFTNGTDVTITGVAGANANTIVNSKVFYVKVANDYPTSGNVALYTNFSLTVAAVGTNLTATPNTGTATFLVASGGGSSKASGSQGSVQFNNGGIIDGSSNLVLTGTNLALAGTFTASNIFANSGTITTGNLITTGIVSTAGNITGGNLIGIFANGTSTIRIPTANGNINMGAAGNTTVLVVTGTGANINGTLDATGTATANYFTAANSLNGYFLANAGTQVGKVYENSNIIKVEAMASTYGVALASNGTMRLQFDANGYGGVGGTGTTGYALRIAKQTTGATTAGSLLINPTVQSDVTALATGIRTSISTAANATPYTITNLAGSATYGGTIGANTTVTNQFAYYVDSTMTGATNNYAFYSGLAANTGTYNLYMNGSANNYMAGSLGIGSTSLSAINMRVSKSLTGGTTAFNFVSDGTIGSDVTTNAVLNRVVGITQAATFTLTNLIYNQAVQGTFGAGSNVTTQSGFVADNTLTGATNNYGFRGSIGAGANRFNLYMDGSANNYMSGNLGIGTTTPAVALHVKQNAGSLNLEGTDQAFMQFYPRGNTTRYAWIGFGQAAGTNNFTITNTDNGQLQLIGGNSNVIINPNANVAISSTGTANVVVVTSTGANVTGTLSVSGNANVSNIGATNGVFTNVSGNGSALTGISSGNISGQVANALVSGTVYTNTQPNITSVGTLTTLSVSGNANIGNIGTGNITAGNITLANASIIRANNMQLTTGANTNPGNITGNWTLTTGSRLQATYADLAEYYEADAVYSPGTVLEFGGDKEVTLAQNETTRVAGVVSTNPAYAMNSNCQGIAVAIALQGRVPTKVYGKVRKGDMMVSAGNGSAKSWSTPVMGTVIGKALENFDGIEGVIEIAIGRL